MNGYDANEFKEVISEEVQRFGLARISKFGNENALHCPSDAIPSVHAYLSAINFYGFTLFTFEAIAVLIVLFMFGDTVYYIIRNAPPRVKTQSAFVLGVYPVVAMAAFCATIVPRSFLLAEAVTQGIFMAGMYQLFCLLVAYCGGEAELIRRVKPTTLRMKVGPCCCWPCCFLPSLEVSKNRVRQLRLLVLQLPVIQGLIYMTLLVMWAERESLYQINYMYVQPIVIVSILFGIWGMSMTIHLLKDVLRDHAMQAKFLVLQMVLLFAKLQGLATRIIVWAGLLPCKPPITPVVYGNLIHNSLMLLEMVLLSFIARRLYKKPLPDLDNLKTISSCTPKIWTTGLKTKALQYFTQKENNNNNIKCADQAKPGNSESS